MSDAQSRWENQRDIDCAEHNQPRCPKFPDHDCEECHESHVEEGEFNGWCAICDDEKCGQCEGTGWVFHANHDEMECPKCEGSGRLNGKSNVRIKLPTKDGSE